MKNLIIAGIVSSFLMGASVTKAVAQEVNTSYDLSFDATQIQSMLDKMSATSLTEADQAFIDSVVRNPLDKNAIEAAQEVIGKRIQWSMYELSELKKIALRYMIVSAQVSEKRYLKLIAKEHTSKAQDHYNRAMWSLAAAHEDLPKVLAECATELCAIQVTEAFKELRKFVENVNEDIDFENAKSEVQLFWKFENPILKTTLDKTFRKMIPNNQDHNAWKAAGAAILSPLSFSGQVAYSYGKAAGSAIFNPRYLNIQFSVEEVKMEYDLIDTQLESLIRSELPRIFNGRKTLSQQTPAERDARFGGNANSFGPLYWKTLEFIQRQVGDPNYVPSPGMMEVAGRYFDRAPKSNDLTVGDCSIDLYSGYISGKVRYGFRYNSDYDNDLKEATIDLVKRMYDGKCDRT